MLFVPVNNKPVNSLDHNLPNRLHRWWLFFSRVLCRGSGRGSRRGLRRGLRRDLYRDLPGVPFARPRRLNQKRGALLCVAAALFYPALTGGDVLSQSPGDKPESLSGKKRTPASQPVKSSEEFPCSSPCTNSARAPHITPAEVVRGQAFLECASVHFGGFIPGYGGFEIFGVGRNECPAVETYVPSHFSSVPAPCRDCQWQDGATIRERENSCSQQLNFLFIAMPNCVRGGWVNTSERVRTCSRELSCHREAGGMRRPGKGLR